MYLACGTGSIKPAGFKANKARPLRLAGLGFRVEPRAASLICRFYTPHSNIKLWNSTTEEGTDSKSSAQSLGRRPFRFGFRAGCQFKVLEFIVLAQNPIPLN